MDHSYCCMRSLNINNNQISKTNDHVKNGMLLQRELHLPVTLSAHLFEDHIVHQMKKLIGGLSNKVKVILKEIIKVVIVVKESIVI